MDYSTEWLEADGLGGFASGTVHGARTRRYHALLLTATTPPTGRMMLVNGAEVWLETPTERFALSAERFSPGVLHPNGHEHLVAFRADPWPEWTFRLPSGVEVKSGLFVPHERSEVVLRWRITKGARLGLRLVVRPFFSGRDYHALHHENGAFRFEPEYLRSGALVFRPYPGVPATTVRANATFTAEPLWYRGFLYEEERARGLDFTEDLAAPGAFAFDLERGDAALVLSAGEPIDDGGVSAPEYANGLAEVERARRSRFTSPLDRAADAYVVRRGAGRTIVAGYPWFTDWGRDTFIALRGLAANEARRSVARDILVAWADHVSHGMLPNLFPDGTSTPEYNSVDASLWYVVAAYEHLAAARTAMRVEPEVEHRLGGAITAILGGYAAGTRFGIGMDDDGLLRAGAPGVQLTWMDAKIGDHVVTPRVGKPVEVQALWLNALRIGAELDPRWRRPFEQGLETFAARFWLPDEGHLADVVDADG